jgi:hypothetical protein
MGVQRTFAEGDGMGRKGAIAVPDVLSATSFTVCS